MKPTEWASVELGTIKNNGQLELPATAKGQVGGENVKKKKKSRTVTWRKATRQRKIHTPKRRGGRQSSVFECPFTLRTISRN